MPFLTSFRRVVALLIVAWLPTIIETAMPAPPELLVFVVALSFPPPGLSSSLASLSAYLVATQYYVLVAAATLAGVFTASVCYRHRRHLIQCRPSRATLYSTVLFLLELAMDSMLEVASDYSLSLTAAGVVAVAFPNIWSLLLARRRTQLSRRAEQQHIIIMEALHRDNQPAAVEQTDASVAIASRIREESQLEILAGDLKADVFELMRWSVEHGLYQLDLAHDQATVVQVDDGRSAAELIAQLRQLVQLAMSSHHLTVYLVKATRTNALSNKSEASSLLSHFDEPTALSLISTSRLTIMHDLVRQIDSALGKDCDTDNTSSTTTSIHSTIINSHEDDILATLEADQSTLSISFVSSPTSSTPSSDSISYSYSYSTTDHIDASHLERVDILNGNNDDTDSDAESLPSLSLSLSSSLNSTPASTPANSPSRPQCLIIEPAMRAAFLEESLSTLSFEINTKSIESMAEIVDADSECM